jgi:hypothetical protein
MANTRIQFGAKFKGGRCGCEVAEGRGPPRGFAPPGPVGGQPLHAYMAPREGNPAYVQDVEATPCMYIWRHVESNPCMRAGRGDHPLHVYMAPRGVQPLHACRTWRPPLACIYGATWRPPLACVQDVEANPGMHLWQWPCLGARAWAV